MFAYVFQMPVKNKEKSKIQTNIELFRENQNFISCSLFYCGKPVYAVSTLISSFSIVMSTYNTNIVPFCNLQLKDRSESVEEQLEHNCNDKIPKQLNDCQAGIPDIVSGELSKNEIAKAWPKVDDTDQLNINNICTDVSIWQADIYTQNLCLHLRSNRMLKHNFK